MKKHLSLLPLAALALAACNPTPTPIVEPVDATTLSLTATGKVDGDVVTTDQKLKAYFYGHEFEVGMIKADDTVSMTLTPAMFDAAPRKTFTDWKAGMTNCDTSKLNVVTDAHFLSVSQAYRDSTADADHLIRPGEVVRSADGSISTYKMVSFYYAKSKAVVTGNLLCGSASTNFNLQLYPGWNKVAIEYTYNHDLDAIVGTREYKSAGGIQTYSGKWVAFFSPK
ncbi:hypothetical protein GCM10008959_03480 [Deinococcus seoulensis]|uniref:Lipoprotein n=1 Tax=Deinococcus seoulensis TaxID=1837379 RepID=A0ABQ2RLU0_9DEIO|nr:hypothetical protein [Deinococcus seoulensis]GGR45589.1 hypothetical protein GCM10008959_03480 [Deinococcus seoulensis]